jgi:hypothetical protein
MSKFITRIELRDEEELTDAEREANEMTPKEIVDVLVQIDPDDLEDLQKLLYERCYEAGGVLT